MVATLRNNGNPEPPIPEVVPRHVAIIMDGNGRWAKARGLPRTEGHRQGTENLRNILKACVEFGIEILTIYAFSTENWKRPRAEVRVLMSILEMVIDRELKELHESGVQIRHIGELEGIAPVLQRKIQYACDYTKDNDKLILNVAFNYGGRDEIIRAVQQIVADGIPSTEIDEDLISSYMYTSPLPDPDLVIRTSGEVRSSNFLVWQSTYSEYYFTPVYWPDFGKEELRKALLEYNRRTRRFGQTDEQINDNS
ncbi:MAG: isoprenyl transferase [Anaerolineae bacterium]|nr:isoprenyl transferase [Anaerolineae bacterium]